MAGYHDPETDGSNERDRGSKDSRHAAMMGEKEKTKKYGNRMEVGPDTVKPVSIELGGRMGTQTIAILQSMTSKLAEQVEAKSVRPKPSERRSS